MYKEKWQNIPFRTNVITYDKTSQMEFWTLFSEFVQLHDEYEFSDSADSVSE